MKKVVVFPGAGISVERRSRPDALFKEFPVFFGTHLVYWISVEDISVEMGY